MQVLAIDIGGTAIKAGLCAENGSIISFDEFPSHADKGGPYLMENLCTIIKKYKGYDRIGISVTGQVDSDKGCIVFADDNVPDFTGTNVRKIVNRRFNVPVYIENDVNAAAMGEAHFGAGQQYNNFLCLTYGTGVGGAIVINGDIYKGAQGIAGEIGHIITHSNGLMCTCGCRGCYERYASTGALVRKALKRDSTLSNGRIIFQRMSEEDPEVKKLVDSWIDEIVFGLISLVHIFNPECIILGGGIMSQSYITSQVEAKLHNSVMKSFSGVEVKKAALGNKAGLMGAAYIAQQNRQ
jgi:glucokinase-like ROK family protein